MYRVSIAVVVLQKMTMLPDHCVNDCVCLNTQGKQEFDMIKGYLAMILHIPANAM